MAWLKSHNDQVDPFNAGEPTLPWEDPEPPREERSCELTGETYDGPTKARDNYDAPSNDGGGKDGLPSSPLSIEEGAPAWADAKADVGRKHGKARRTAHDTKKPSKSGGSVTSRLLKAFKLIVVLIIIANLLPLATSLISDVVDAPSAEDDEPGYSSVHVKPDTSYEPSPEDSLESSACADTARSLIEKQLVPGSELHQRAIESFEEDIEYVFGCTPQDLGIDPAVYADWIIDNTSLSVHHVNLISENTRAFVYLDGTIPYGFGVTNDFINELIDFLSDKDVVDSEGGIALTDELQQEIRDLLTDFLAKAKATDEPYQSLELNKVDGVWTIPSEDLLTDLEDVLGV